MAEVQPIFYKGNKSKLNRYEKINFFTSSPHFSVVSATTGINGKRCITDSRGMGLTVVHLIIYYMGMGVTRGDTRLISRTRGG